MRVLLTSSSFIDTPGVHHDLIKQQNWVVDYLRGPIKEDDLFPIIGNYNAVICGDDHYTRKVLTKGRKGGLRFLSKYGIGLDQIDLAAAQDLGIMVVNTPGTNHITVAEHTFTHILAFYRSYVKEIEYTKRGEWKRITGREVFNKNISIYGLGRIGKEVALRAKAFGMSVTVHDLFPDIDFIKNHSLLVANNLLELVNRSDIITIHAPLTHNTKHAFNDNLFANMKNRPLIVNTSRANIIDKSALIKALDKGIISGYLTDVMWKEPMSPNDELTTYENVFITPHIGSRTYESVARQGCAAINNLKELIQRNILLL
jgi:D-3-phosphoglycerate dehydrogenase